MSKNQSTTPIILITFFLEALGITLAITRSIIRQKSWMRYFDEGAFMSWFSFAQLIITSGLAWQVFQVRKQTFLKFYHHQKYQLWALIAIGFLFLGIDEVIQIHEKTDDFIH